VLRAHGWTPQRPPTQAKERDEALIKAWLARDLSDDISNWICADLGEGDPVR
jgi:hypothetical protein